ncbi:Armadillo repeat-containing protein 3 [Chelonia mydas]|uniref:Armadillo repeat-containing protein 3 n=1 Tax=Chelonia mydas TaxID=8469 RepID=M7BGG4_CHEMY|nr:Armadillo repeat-containing protein 3 [Chelonia mydas]
MATQEPLRFSIQSRGVMNAIVEPLQSTNSLVQSKAALTVAALGCDADARTELRNASGLEPLVKLLHSKNDEVRRNACWAVMVCASDELTAVELCRLGALDILEEINLSTGRKNNFSEGALEKLLDNNLSQKYSQMGYLSSSNIITDGFYDYGQVKPGVKLLSLEELNLQELNDHRAIILVNAKLPDVAEDKSQDRYDGRTTSSSSSIRKSSKERASEPDVQQQAEFSPPASPPLPEPFTLQVTAHKHQPQFPYFAPPWAGPHFSYPMPWPQWYPWLVPTATHPHDSSTSPQACSAPYLQLHLLLERLNPLPEEVNYEPYPDSPTPNSPSAPDRTLIPPPPQNMDDFKQFQELFKRMALNQDIPLEEVQETQHRLLKILQPSAPSKIVLSVNEALLELADTLWQTPASIPPTCKKAERKYYVPAKDVDFLFSHSQPNSLVVDAVTHGTKQPQYQPTPQDKDLKHLDLLGRKIYTSSTLQFRIANYSAPLASYDFDNYNKLFDFTSHILEDRRADFKSVLVEGQLVSRMALQSISGHGGHSSPHYRKCGVYVQIFLAVCKRKGKGKKEEEKPKDEEELQTISKIQQEVILEKVPWLPPFDSILLDYIMDASKIILPLTTTKEQVVALAQFVADKMGGPIERDKLHEFSWELHISEIEFELKCNVVPIGKIKKGTFYHRALLFKVIADRIGIGCSLVRGEYGRAWNEVKLVDDSPQGITGLLLPPQVYILDLMYQPGCLMKQGSAEADHYQRI